MIRACCGTPDDARAPSPHAPGCRYAAAPASSGGPLPIHRFRPCDVCGGSPDIHNPNRGRDYIGHEYR